MQPSSAQDLIRAASELIAIPSIAQEPAALHQAVDFIAAMIRDRCPDATVERFERNGKPSLLAYKGDRRPANFRIILNGHVDVVPGKPELYRAVIKDGNLYGRGAYDMKAAAVVMTAVFCEFVGKLPYPLGLQIVADEESAGPDGTLYQIEQGVRADFVISGECGRAVGTYEIANEAKGIVVAEVGFHGNAAHSAYPWRGDNAILRALRFIQALHERYPVPTAPSQETLISVTAMSGDSGAHSQLPDYAAVKLAARYTAGDPDFQTKRRFINLISTLDPEAEIVTIHDFTPPFRTDPRNPLLLQLKASAEAVEGREFSFVRRHGTGDGRFYAGVGSQACEFGIAGEHPHGDNEHIPLDAFHKYLQTMRDFLARTAAGTAA